MRTTVTLDSDVEALIRTAMKERGLSFKAAVNAAVRQGLKQGKQSKQPFTQTTFKLGSHRNFNWDKALAIAEALDDEELTRKLSLRK